MFRTKINSQTVDNIRSVFEEIVHSNAFLDTARWISSRMIASTGRESDISWRAAANKASNGKHIYELLRNELANAGIYQELVERNAYYIQSAPLDIAESMARKAADMQAEGLRASEIAQELLKMYPAMSKSKANLIARTEASKASAAITQNRSQKLGINWYIWKGSEDQRERLAHKNMNDVLCSYNDPPSPEKLIGVKSTLGAYSAGQAPNCRCYAEPLVDLDQVHFPARVYYGGRISRMTRGQFERIM